MKLRGSWKKGAGKAVCALFAAALLCLLPGNSGFQMRAMAGQWRENGTGWWYDDGDGSWPASEWRWIDGDGDGVSECYYFDENGYCLLNGETPDGFTVNENGAWTERGLVPTRRDLSVRPVLSGMYWGCRDDYGMYTYQKRYAEEDVMITPIQDGGLKMEWPEKENAAPRLFAASGDGRTYTWTSEDGLTFVKLSVSASDSFSCTEYVNESEVYRTAYQREPVVVKP